MFAGVQILAGRMATAGGRTARDPAAGHGGSSGSGSWAQQSMVLPSGKRSQKTMENQ